MIDLHCHILPGVDDGPRDAEESLRMAELAVRDGIRTIVATPHSYNGDYCNNLESIVPHCTRLNTLVQSRGLPLNVLPGAEVRIHQGMERFVREEKIASLNNTQQYLLVELPHNMVLPGTGEVLYQLTANDITPMLAHPERNTALQRNPDTLAGLVDMGCLVQLTAMSITGELGSDAMAYAHFLLRKGQAHVIASDAHDAENRPPILSPAVKEAARVLGDLKAAEAMVNQTPRAILDGEPFNPYEPQKVLKKRWWEKWLGRKGNY